MAKRQNNKKGEIGTIILLILLIGAVYVINHPPKEDTLIIQNGTCNTNINTEKTQITFINKDNVDYIIFINNEKKNISANSKAIFEFPKGVHQYNCEANPSIKGEIKINVEGYKCERCRHEWIPRNKEDNPIICPKCKSPYWDKPKKMK